MKEDGPAAAAGLVDVYVRGSEAKQTFVDTERLNILAEMSSENSCVPY